MRRGTRSAVGVLWIGFLGLVTSCQKHEAVDDTAPVVQLCSLNTDERSSLSGIFGGVEATQDEPLAHHLVSLVAPLPSDDSQVEVCTGVIIAEDLILTAAHCIVGKDEEMKVIFSNSIVKPSCPSPQSIRKVAQTLVHEKYSSTASYLEKNDLAFVKIKGELPLGYRPVDLLDESNSIGDGDFFVAGYGVSSSAADDVGVLKITQVHRTMEAAREGAPMGGQESKVVTLTDQSPVLVFDQTEGHGVCMGDSGGGAFIQLNGEYILVGIASVVMNSSQSEVCQGVSAHMNLNYYRSWLRTSMTSLSASLAASPSSLLVVSPSSLLAVSPSSLLAVSPPVPSLTSKQ